MHYSHLLALLALTPSTLARYSKAKDAVKLSQIKSLTLRGDALTSARRVEPIPQLACIGGNAKGLYNVDVMRCTNAGSEYGAEDIQWTCKASLPPEFKLGSTDVICEGYDNPDDPYILKGSCGVEYRLILTPQGEQKYHDRVSSKAWRSKNGEQSSRGDQLASFIFWIFFIAVACVILYSVCAPSPLGRGGANRRGGNTFWGGGGDGGDDDPPPPYTPRNPRSKTSYSSRGYSTRQDEPWRPGFWSGTAAGTAAGYAAGAWNANRQRRNEDARNSWAQPGPSSWNTPSGSGGWGGGSSSSSPSSSRHESTGFGGTRRR